MLTTGYFSQLPPIISTSLPNWQIFFFYNSCLIVIHAHVSINRNQFWIFKEHSCEIGKSSFLFIVNFSFAKHFFGVCVTKKTLLVL